jgi:hypothetical protein
LVADVVCSKRGRANRRRSPLPTAMMSEMTTASTRLEGERGFGGQPHHAGVWEGCRPWRTGSAVLAIKDRWRGRVRRPSMRRLSPDERGFYSKQEHRSLVEHWVAGVGRRWATSRLSRPQEQTAILGVKAAATRVQTANHSPGRGLPAELCWCYGPMPYLRTGSRR